MREVVPQCPWSFLARALGYRNQVRRYLLLVATLYPIAYLLFFVAVIGIATAMPGYWWLHLRPVSSRTR